MKLIRTAATAAIGLALVGGPVAAATAAPVARDSSSVPQSNARVSPDVICSPFWHQTLYHKGYEAGYSWAWTKLVGYGSTGNRVREVQCLTKWEHFKPGKIDGIYGSNTKKAVKRAQKWCGIGRDGIVGPKTWVCLRAEASHRAAH